MRIVDLFHFQAREHPNREFAVHHDRTMTYEQAEDLVLRTVTALQNRGIHSEDRVGILAVNCIEFVTTYLACADLGCVPVPLNYRLTPHELSYILSDSGARLVLCSPEFLPLLQGLPDARFADSIIVLSDEDRDRYEAFSRWTDVKPAAAGSLGPLQGTIPAFQCYTSGTTGAPKGVLMSNDAMAWYALTQGAPLEAAGVLDGRLLVTAPVFHAGITALWMTSIAWGGSLYIHDRFIAEKVVTDLRQENIAWTLLIPSMIQICLTNVPEVADHPYPTLKLIVYGGSSIAEDTLRRAMEVFNCDFLQQYGLTETNAIVNLSTRDHREALRTHPSRLLAAGRPLPGCAVRVVDTEGRDVDPGTIGEIVLSGPHIMDGYWNSPSATRNTLRDGWLWTGDAGSLDEQGYLYVRDRIKDVIVTGGENVYSREVESVLFDHPSVADAAVIGVPDPIWGEAVKAVVVTVAGSEFRPDEIISYCRERLANYKCPKTIDLVSELPRNPSGKVLKRELRRQFSEL